MAPALEIKNSRENARAAGRGCQPVTGHQESVGCEAGGETRLLLAAAQPRGEWQLCLYLQQLGEGVSAVFLLCPCNGRNMFASCFPEY